MEPQELPTNPMQFARAFDLAAETLVAARHHYEHALSLGIRPIDLVLYVKGALTPQERAEVTQQLVVSPWARLRVVALMKAKRDESSTVYQSVRTQILNHYARDKTWLDEEFEGAKLLDTL